MKFRHTIHVFIDNFSLTYKQLLYKVIITAVFLCATAAIIAPFINTITSSVHYTNLITGVKELLKNLVQGKTEQVAAATELIENSFREILDLVAKSRSRIIWSSIGILLLYLVQKFFLGLGNYAMAAVINDKMAMRANSPFMTTLVRNLKPACLYNLMYVPLSFVYDALTVVILYFLIFKLFALVPIIIIPVQLFLFVSMFTLLTAVKMTFTADWLPALIRGKATQKDAFIFTFDRRKKSTLNVLSHFIVLVLLIFAMNVIAIICTFCAALLITIPASYILLVSYEFVNYYDREELIYSIDKNTIIKPEREHTLTREEFFKGQD